MDSQKRKEIVIVFICLLMGFVLRFYAFDKKSLWMDEVHTFNDSRDDLKGQIQFYKKNPFYLHPPLFFILTHHFHPFTKPERDLRIIPLIFGSLSVPMIYLLARQFSLSIAIPCALSLAFMTYHISLSQDGRSYSLLMFLGMVTIYFFIRHLKTPKRQYLLLMAFAFSVLFYTSYSSIPFIVLSQILWFYRPNEGAKRFSLSSFLILNGLILLFCLPWIIFLAANYNGQTTMDPFHVESTGSFGDILYGVLHDWVPHAPLMIVSVTLLILLPILSKLKKNALILLAVFLFPIGGLYLFCESLKVTHFVSSRYFINFLPLFFITLYLSLEAIEFRFKGLKGFLRLRFLFAILFVASNLIILPLYYRSEKQNFKSLVTYLRGHVRQGDKIFVRVTGYMPPMLHYFESYPEKRHHVMKLSKESGKVVRVEKSFVYQNRILMIMYSKTCCSEHVLDGSRLWIVVDKFTAKNIKQSSPSVLKGYFDGSFLNFTRFPDDASMYLFLWDPNSPGEKGIDIPMN